MAFFVSAVKSGSKVSDTNKLLIFWLVKYYLNNTSNYLNIIFVSFVVLMTKL